MRKNPFSRLAAVKFPKNPFLYVLLAVLIVHFAITFMTLHDRYMSFEIREPVDSSTYMQVSWSVFHGTPFTTSIQERWVSFSPHNFLGDQLIFTLALFSPLLLVSTSGVLFLILQTVIISLGAVFLYAYASRKLGNQAFAVMITTCYLFHMATFLSFQFFGFRVETLFIPLLFAVFYYVERKRIVQASIFLILTLLTKHNAIPIVFTLGVYFVAVDRVHWRFGIVCMCAALVYYLVGVGWIMGHFQQNDVAHFKHLARFGATPWQALFHLLLNPALIIAEISKLEISHFLAILFPYGFLSMLHPIFWISSFQLLIIALLDDYHSVFCGWHWAVVVPFIFVGMTATTAWVVKRIGNRKVVVYALTILLGGGLLFHLNAYNKHVIQTGGQYYFKNNPIDSKRIMSVLSEIDKDASVMASGQLLWNLYDRERIFHSAEKFHDEVDYVAVLLPVGFAHYRNTDNNLIKELKKKVRNKGSKLDAFDLVHKSKNLHIYKKPVRNKTAVPEKVIMEP